MRRCSGFRINTSTRNLESVRVLGSGIAQNLCDRVDQWDQDLAIARSGRVKFSPLERRLSPRSLRASDIVPMHSVSFRSM